MNGIDFLADTNFLIYLLEGRTEAAAFADFSFGVSFVTEIELLGRVGLSQNEAASIQALLSDCVVIDLTQDIKQGAIRLRQQRRIKLPDALIAATAHYLNLPLLTADAGFGQITGINVVLLPLTS